MLRTRDRILLGAFAMVFAGTASGWALLAVLPPKAAPRPAAGTGAVAYAGGDATGAQSPAAPPASLPPARAPASAGAPEATAPAAAPAQDPPPTGRVFRFKFEDGTSASLDPETGRMRVHTRFGDLELKL